MINAIFPVLLESALRGLAGALFVWAALRLLRVRNVRTQKTAWTLMLAAALAMPLLMRWQWLPASDAIPVPRAVAPAISSAIFWLRSAALPADPNSMLADAANLATRLPVPPPFAWSAPSNADNGRILLNQPRPAGGISPASGMSIDPRDAQAAPPDSSEPAPLPQDFLPPPQAADPPSSLHLFDLAWAMYLAVAAVLLLRLIIGALSATRLWMTARPVRAPIAAELAPAGAVRWSPRLNSPANIGSGVLLPANYRQWSDEKLRVVLAHEREHVRQGDFYLQLLAGLYAALVWFSPLGWWLMHRLSELGEAISDRAGVEEAASPSSYAQMLLEFAALPRPIGTGVAMARSGRLASRIDRLLNDSTFRQAFAAGGRRAVLALVIAPLALLASTAVVRVQAASQSTAPPQAMGAQITEASQQSGVSNPPAQSTADPAPSTAGQDQQKPSPAPSPVPPPNPDAAPSPAPSAPSAPEPAPAPAAGADEGVGSGSGQGQGTGADAVQPSAPSAPPPQSQSPVPPVRVQVPRVHVHVRPISPDDMIMPPMPDADGEVGKFFLQSDGMKKNFYFLSNGHQFYAFDNGEPWALIPAQGEPITSAHPLDDADRAEIDKARNTAHAPFFWFKHDGKSYIVEDPSVVAQVEALEKPIEDLRGQMRALGSQQRQLGRQLRQQMRTQRQQSIPKPDLSKQMADLNAAVDSLKSSQGDTVTQAQLRKLQEQVAQLQGQIARAESGFYKQNGQWGDQMSAVGKQMGKLGSQQGHLAGEMIRMSLDSRSKIDAIIQQSLSDGKAKPQN